MNRYSLYSSSSLWRPSCSSACIFADRLSVLRIPTLETLASVAAALEAGWVPDMVGGVPAAQARLHRIRTDPDGVLAAMNPPPPDPAANPLTPASLHRRSWWIWHEGAVAGEIGLRWQRDPAGRPVPTLPPTTLGHVGYTVMPSRRRLGLATRALGEVCAVAAALGLPHLEAVCAEDNTASRRAIEACGGFLVERFEAPPERDGWPALRLRIHLPAAQAMGAHERLG